MTKYLHRLLEWWRGSPPVEVEKEAPPIKTQKPKKEQIELCIVTDKAMFTREQAEESRKRLVSRTQNNYLRIYCCQYCSQWHLTHKKRYRW